MPYKIVSLTGKEWNVLAGQQIPKNADELLDILAKNRGINDLDGFVHVSVKNQMPDPFVFVGMEKAVNRIAEAIISKQKIAILGDYDVDGISSVSVFVKFFQAIGADCDYFIPDRMEDGYGLNTKSIDKYKDSLIIAVDCGSNSLTELAYAKNLCVDVIVIDHHKMSQISQDAAAIINPQRPDEKDDFKYLCATGLVFICAVGVNRKLKE
ncbi:MAG: DHH family phosphoesterase, partial [Alphaproteobacteria bacterium]|nr:DHH family phosphoesterase [Alphaproteobacteria bacterium]